MQKNFTIYAFAQVIVGDTSADIHNVYKATSISTDLTAQVLTLRFERDQRWPGLPDVVTLVCSGNLKIAFNDLVHAPIPLRKDAVEIAYYDEDCQWDEFLDEDQAAAQGFEGLHLSFSGGLVLRIRSDIAEVSTS